MQDYRTGAGGSQLAKIFFIRQESKVAGAGRCQGGNAGERCRWFTGELETEAVRQFSQ